MERTTTVMDAFAPWTQVQQTFWERWRPVLVDGATPAHSATSLWSLPIELWRAALYGSLDLQLATAEAWKAWVCANDANIPELTLGTCQTLHFMEDWTRSQMRLWEGWFAALEGLAPPSSARLAAPAREAPKPRLHVRGWPHGMRTHLQPHNGVAA